MQRHCDVQINPSKKNKVISMKKQQRISFYTRIFSWQAIFCLNDDGAVYTMKRGGTYSNNVWPKGKQNPMLPWHTRLCIPSLVLALYPFVIFTLIIFYG